MRAHRGFTLIELMVVVAILAIVATTVVMQGRSARQNAQIADGAYELALRIQGMRGRALADGRDHLLVVVDAQDRAACEHSRLVCARYFHLVTRRGVAFDLAAFDPATPTAMADYDDDWSDFLPRGVRLDLAPTWVFPAPFNTVIPWDPAIRRICRGGRACFALRFTARGEVRPEPMPAATPRGFSFVLEPVNRSTGAAERRAFLVTFPAGIMKTEAY